MEQQSLNPPHLQPTIYVKCKCGKVSPHLASNHKDAVILAMTRAGFKQSKDGKSLLCRKCAKANHNNATTN